MTFVNTKILIIHAQLTKYHHYHCRFLHLSNSITNFLFVFGFTIAIRGYVDKNFIFNSQKLNLVFINNRKAFSFNLLKI